VMELIFGVYRTEAAGLEITASVPLRCVVANSLPEKLQRPEEQSKRAPR
jgi:hypothetical protein